MGQDRIEQPVRAGQYALMARLRDTFDVVVLADESVSGPEDMQRAVTEGICDGVSVRIMTAGGLTRARRMAETAADAGLTAYGGDMFETGLAHLAGAHLIAATPAITRGCEFYQARYYLRDDILEAPFPVRAGREAVPDTPGLGISPALDVLERHAKYTTFQSATEMVA